MNIFAKKQLDGIAHASSQFMPRLPHFHIRQTH
jgi:hypothetical protein